MSGDAANVFKAKISAHDDTAQAMSSIVESMKRLQAALGKTGEKAEQTHHKIKKLDGVEHVFARLGGRVQLLRGHFVNLNATIGQTFGRLTSMVPALAGLGGVASIAGAFKLTEKVAEDRLATLAEARKLGLGDRPGALGGLKYVSAMNDVSTESMEGGLARLARNRGEAAFGGKKGQELNRLLTHIGVKATDSPDEALLKIATSMSRTPNANVRAAAARRLFGNAGVEMMPMLLKGREGLQEELKTGRGLAYSFTPQDDKNLEDYRNSMLQLRIAVGSVGKAIGAQLAPVLTPIIQQFKDWVVTNRQWIATGLKTALASVGDYLKSVDWAAFGTDLKDGFAEIRSVVTQLGGLANVAKILIGLRLASWGLGLTSTLLKVAQAAAAAVKALGGVKAATEAANAAKVAGGAAGGAGASGAGAAGAAGAPGAAGTAAGAGAAGVASALVLAMAGVAAGLSIKAAKDDADRVASATGGGSVNRITGDDMPWTSGDLFGRKLGPDGQPSQGFLERNGLGWVHRVLHPGGASEGVEPSRPTDAVRLNVAPPRSSAFGLPSFQLPHIHAASPDAMPAGAEARPFPLSPLLLPLPALTLAAPDVRTPMPSVLGGAGAAGGGLGAPAEPGKVEVHIKVDAPTTTTIDARSEGNVEPPKVDRGYSMPALLPVG